MLLFALMACSSGAVVLDGGIDGSPADAPVAEAGADNAVNDAASVDATMSDAGYDTGVDSSMTCGDSSDGAITILTYAAGTAFQAATDGVYLYWTSVSGEVD